MDRLDWRKETKVELIEPNREWRGGNKSADAERSQLGE